LSRDAAGDNEFSGRFAFGPKRVQRNSIESRRDLLVDGDHPGGTVLNVAARNLDAIEELVSRHNRRIYRTLLAIVGNIDDAKDVMEDTFLKAFQHISTFQRRSKFST
jgi:hypothetical protein